MITLLPKCPHIYEQDSNDINQNHNNKNNYLKIYEGDSKNEKESAGDEKEINSSICEDFPRIPMKQL